MPVLATGYNDRAPLALQPSPYCYTTPP